MNSLAKMARPYIAWAIVFIIIPMLLVLFYGFTQFQGQIKFQFTLEHFIKFFTEPEFLKVLWLSVRIALITTVICVLLGYPCAYFISLQKSKMQPILILLITMPMWINMLVRTYAWTGILQDTGVINNFLEMLNLPKMKLIHTDFAVILGMVYNFIPFMIIQIYISLSKMDPSLLQASEDLGATPRQTFYKVILPLSIPGVIAGITLVFLPAISSFVIPQFLGGGQYIMLGTLVETQFLKSGEWHFGSAISTIMAITIFLSMYITKKLDRDIGGK